MSHGSRVLILLPLLCIAARSQDPDVRPVPSDLAAAEAALVAVRLEHSRLSFDPSGEVRNQNRLLIRALERSAAALEELVNRRRDELEMTRLLERAAEFRALAEAGERERTLESARDASAPTIDDGEIETLRRSLEELRAERTALRQIVEDRQAVRKGHEDRRPTAADFLKTLPESRAAAGRLLAEAPPAARRLFAEDLFALAAREAAVELDGRLGAHMDEALPAVLQTVEARRQSVRALLDMREARLRRLVERRDLAGGIPDPAKAEEIDATETALLRAVTEAERRRDALSAAGGAEVAEESARVTEYLGVLREELKLIDLLRERMSALAVVEGAAGDVPEAETRIEGEMAALRQRAGVPMDVPLETLTEDEVRAKEALVEQARRREEEERTRLAALEAREKALPEALAAAARGRDGAVESVAAADRDLDAALAGRRSAAEVRRLVEGRRAAVMRVRAAELDVRALTAEATELPRRIALARRGVELAGLRTQDAVRVHKAFLDGRGRSLTLRRVATLRDLRALEELLATEPPHGALLVRQRIGHLEAERSLFDLKELDSRWRADLAELQDRGRRIAAELGDMEKDLTESPLGVTATTEELKAIVEGEKQNEIWLRSWPVRVRAAREASRREQRERVRAVQRQLEGLSAVRGQAQTLAATAGRESEWTTLIAPAWDLLRKDFEANLTERRRIVESLAVTLTEFEKGLGTALESSVRLRDRARDVLLWSRERSQISMTAIQKAVQDADRIASAAVAGAGPGILAVLRALPDLSRAATTLAVVAACGAAVALVVLLHRRVGRRLPATTVTNGTWRSLRLPGLVLLTALRRSQTSLILAAAVPGGAELLGAGGDLVRELAVAGAMYFGLRLSASLARVLLAPGRPEERPLPIPDEAAAGVHRPVARLLWASAFLLPPTHVLARLGYADPETGNPGFMELLRLAWQVVALLIVLLLAVRPRALLTRIAHRKTREARWRIAIIAGWPVVVVVAVSLHVLDRLGYAYAAGYLLERILLSSLAIAGAVFLHRLIARVLLRTTGVEKARDPDRREPAEEAGETAADRRKEDIAAFGAALIGLVAKTGAIVVAVALVLRVWELTGLRLRFLLDLPILGRRAGITLGSVLTAGLVVLGTFLLSDIVRKTLSLLIFPKTRIESGLRYAIITLLSYVFVATGLLVALGAVGIGTAQLGWFLAAAGVGIGFGLQDIVANFVAGLVLLIERPVKVDDVVTVGDQVGRVVRITIRSTVITTIDNFSIIVPNRELISTRVINWSHNDTTVRDSVTFDVAYGADVQLVREITLEILRNHGLVLKRPPPEILFHDFGASGLRFTATYFIDVASPMRRVRSDLRFALDAAFRKRKIEIPFSKHDIYIKEMPGPGGPGAAGDSGSRESTADAAAEEGAQRRVLP